MLRGAYVGARLYCAAREQDIHDTALAMPHVTVD